MTQTLKVEHISTYLLEVEPNTRFGRSYSEFEGPLPSEEELEHIFKTTHEYLMARGYERYSLASFSQPGHESVHNGNYWRNRANFIGIGVGAYSKLNSTRFGNGKNLKKYLQTFESDENLAFKKAAIFEFFEEKYDLQSDLNDLVYGMVISKEGLSADLFSEFLKFQIWAKNIEKGKKLTIGGETVTLTSSNYGEIG